jgi:hypothetical protein
MKYLNDYTEEAISNLLNENGAFFAFSDKQFEEQKKEGIKYVSMFAGLLCPKPNAEKVEKGLLNITKQGIALDIAENGKEAIIARELNNHEAYYTGDIDSTIQCLSGYDFTEDEIKTVYIKEREKQNDNNE